MQTKILSLPSDIVSLPSDIIVYTPEDLGIN